MQMLRSIDVVMIGLLLGGAAFTFKVKHDSEVAIEKVTKLQNEIKAEQEAIDILKADWSLLNDPKRLQALVQRYQEQLGIEQLDPQAIGSFAEIPIKPPQLPDPEGGDIASLIDAAPDNEIKTGAVKGDESQ
jgi:hypothetical protein